MGALRTGFLTGLTALAVSISPAFAELEPEEIPAVETLPADYPADWIFAHDINFFALVDGKVVIVDVASENRNLRGSLGAGQFAAFVAARSRPELYVAETFYSRGTRGDRTDVFTIYDKSTLSITGEIILPGGKRAQSVSQKGSLQLSGDERFAFVFNFTPAASISIIDLDARKILNEIQIPGCSLIYPLGERDFATLCGNGTMASFNLDASGQVTGRSITEAFNDIDADPLFMKSALVDGVRYFPSFKGRMQPVRMTGISAEVLPDWPLAPGDAAANNWRPAGWQVITSDGAGRIYVLMQEGAVDGGHKDGGGEVWIFDPTTKTRVARVALPNWGVSIEATKGAKPYLVVTNGDFELDVFDPGSGEKIRKIGGRIAETPFALHAVDGGQ